MDNLFKGILRGRVVIVGIGNILRGDDALGPELIRMLRDTPGIDPSVYLIDAGEVPENYLEKIIQHKPDTILLVDAADMDREPGSIDILAGDELAEAGFSTHNASLKLTIKYLKAGSKADIFLLGVQPETLDMGSKLSAPVKAALERIIEELQAFASLETSLRLTLRRPNAPL